MADRDENNEISEKIVGLILTCVLYGFIGLMTSLELDFTRFQSICTILGFLTLGVAIFTYINNATIMIKILGTIIVVGGMVLGGIGFGMEYGMKLCIEKGMDECVSYINNLNN